ncbi:MAG: hypothetical protein NTZ33_15700 [Bacteroidetes bacterium]|nr:hypothetical protein [Bacteroidota bacterium]
MKSKRAQRILFFCVLVVWGLIFYRLFLYLKKEDSNNSSLTVNLHQSDSKISTDSLNLLLNYPDPFHLSKLISLQINEENKSNSHSRKLIAPKNDELIAIPKIIYKGCIYNQIKHKNIGILVLNQTSSFIKEGDSIQNWEVAKIYKDSVLITHSKQRICIILSK